MRARRRPGSRTSRSSGDVGSIVGLGVTSCSRSSGRSPSVSEFLIALIRRRSFFVKSGRRFCISRSSGTMSMRWRARPARSMTSTRRHRPPLRPSPDRGRCSRSSTTQESRKSGSTIRSRSTCLQRTTAILLVFQAEWRRDHPRSAGILMPHALQNFSSTCQPTIGCKSEHGAHRAAIPCRVSGSGWGRSAAYSVGSPSRIA